MSDAGKARNILRPYPRLRRQRLISHFAPADTQPPPTQDEPITQVPKGSFILPTFCDLHLHAPQYLYQGTGLDLPLMEWLNNYAYQAEERLDNDPILAEKVYRRLAERLVENGTGAVLVFGTIKEETNLILAKAMQSTGIRAFVGKLSMDRSMRPSYVESSAQFSLSSAKQFIQSCRALVSHLPPHERLVEPVLTPRFTPTCSDALLLGLGEIAQNDTEGLRIQSHLAEARDQVDWVSRERGKEDIDVFDNAGLLTARTIQAHCTFLPPSSLGRLSERGTSVAHCPLSNAYFSSEKAFKLREALQIGVKVGLGTDIAGGYSLDIMNSMRQTVIASRLREGRRREEAKSGPIPNREDTNLSVDWKEALYLATRGGALALGLPHSGVFAVGSPFDAQQIALFDPSTKQGVGSLDFFDLENGPEEHTIVLTEDMVEKWWCVGDTRNRACTWVQGKRVYLVAPP